ncbi:MAG: exodeoxyribonuclease VII small subunit [Bifidobacteriaceae bacterium]|nr:exodeoxyribonuclease VII small subunit [Bifidobacteriaceae bacterium]
MADIKETNEETADTARPLEKVEMKGMTDEDRARIASMSYEDARDQLTAIVDKLQRGGLSLEDSLRYWQIGEALATRAQALLQEVRSQLDAAREQQQSGAQHAGTQLG